MKLGVTFLAIISIALNSFGSFEATGIDTFRGFDQEKIEAYKVNPDFVYIHKSQVSHWSDGLYEWLADILSDWFKDKDATEIGIIIHTIFKVALWALLIFALGMLTHSLYKNGVFGVLGRKKQELELSFNDLENQVLETDWQLLINKAVMNSQFNIATRLLFLQLLQSLNKGNLIEWDKAKSIRDYNRELGTQYQHDFSSLARYYQYSWFGNVVIDASHFNEIQEEFKTFNQSTSVA